MNPNQLKPTFSRREPPNGAAVLQKPKATAPPGSGVERILLRTDEAAKLCHVSVKTWRTWNKLGKVPQPLIIGKLHFWRYDELVLWVDAGCPARQNWEACRFTAERASARRENPLLLVAGVNTKKRRSISNTKT